MKLSKPKLFGASLSPGNLRQLVAEAQIERVYFSRVDASRLRARNLGLDAVRLEKVTLAEAKLEKLNVTDAELRNCDLSGARCPESSLIRTHIFGSRLTGVDLSRSIIKDTVFEDCKIDMVNFRVAKLQRVRFVNCLLIETDFQAAQLDEVEFKECHLEKVEFGQARTKGLDLRDSRLLDIRGWQMLRGAKIDSLQLVMIAPQLARELGLVVSD